MASVIEAAQRKAQLENQSQTQANQQLVEGLGAIGQIGQNLVDKRLKVAQALALGKQFGMDEKVAQSIGDPEQILKIQAVNKGMLDADFLRSAMLALAGKGTPQLATADKKATSTSATSAPATNGAVLASDTITTPVTPPPAYIPNHPADGNGPQPLFIPNPAVASPSVQVPIQAPPPRPKMVNATTAKMALDVARANAMEPVMSKEAALAAGSVPHGTKIVEPTGTKTDQKEQDAYWKDAVSGIRSIRGDTAMKDIESQRNAAITAYNRLKDIELTGKAPNPVDYIDILGQVYKARTGQAPTEEVFKSARQATGQAQFGKYWTYFTGQQMPGTSKDIASSLKDMVAHMGLQADDLHDGYMQVHGSEVFNPKMSDENKSKLSKLTRGKSFTNATGVKPEDYDVHLQAIKWAQANPNDPRSAPILQKALQEKAATSGGSVGL